MEWIGIDWANPLILLRLYLTALWLGTAGYAAWVWRSLPRGTSAGPLAGYSIFASLLGAGSYFIGASTTFSSATGFMWVAGLLSFTPIALVLWLYRAKKKGGV